MSIIRREDLITSLSRIGRGTPGGPTRLSTNIRPQRPKGGQPSKAREEASPNITKTHPAVNICMWEVLGSANSAHGNHGGSSESSKCSTWNDANGTGGDRCVSWV